MVSSDVLQEGEPALSIRPLVDEQELAIVAQALPSTSSDTHRLRLLLQQQGAACYLIAWYAGRPAGHVLIRWQGSSPAVVAAAEGAFPELEDLYVAPPLRGRSIGLRLLQAAEALVRGRGWRRLGLAVGLNADAAPARALYQRSGFRSAGFSPYYEGWWTRDAHGAAVWWEEAVEYLIKPLETEDNCDE